MTVVITLFHKSLFLRGERERYIYRTMSILFSLTFQHIFHLSFTCQQHLVTVCVGLLLLYSVLPFTSDLQFYGLTCTLDDNRTFSCTCVIRLTYPTLHSKRAFFLSTFANSLSSSLSHLKSFSIVGDVLIEFYR